MFGTCHRGLSVRSARHRSGHGLGPALPARRQQSGTLGERILRVAYNAGLNEDFQVGVLQASGNGQGILQGLLGLLQLV